MERNQNEANSFRKNLYKQNNRFFFFFTISVLSTDKHIKLNREKWKQ